MSREAADSSPRDSSLEQPWINPRIRLPLIIATGALYLLGCTTPPQQESNANLVIRIEGTAQRVYYGSPTPEITPTALVLPTVDRTALALRAPSTATLTRGSAQGTATAVSQERLAASKPTSSGSTPILKP